MKRTFYFNAQNNIGKAGEKLFCSFYANLNPSTTDGIKHDLVVENGKTVEIKTDTYSMEATPNFFFERYGNDKTLKPGGPWRAVEDGIDYFVYFFLQDKTFFWLDPVKLTRFLDKYTQDLKPKTVQNKGYSSIGYCVPREVCEELFLRVDSF
jgi:hypothetical protein